MHYIFTKSNIYLIKDINECIKSKNICGNKQSICTNLIGSYRCDCKQGYIRDTKECIYVGIGLKNNYNCL